jgi:hypothetical protein
VTAVGSVTMVVLVTTVGSAGLVTTVVPVTTVGSAGLVTTVVPVTTVAPGAATVAPVGPAAPAAIAKAGVTDRVTLVPVLVSREVPEPFGELGQLVR